MLSRRGQVRQCSRPLPHQAQADRLGFWETQARELVSWDTEWSQVLDWSDPPFARWFVGGELNVAYNCVDRHVEAGYGDQVAIHWVGEPQDETRTITYAALQSEVNRAANALEALGIGKGDRIALLAENCLEYIILFAARATGASYEMTHGETFIIWLLMAIAINLSLKEKK